MNADKDQVELDYLDETDDDCPNPETIRLLDRQPQVRVHYLQDKATLLCCSLFVGRYPYNC